MTNRSTFTVNVPAVVAQALDELAAAHGTSRAEAAQSVLGRWSATAPFLPARHRPTAVTPLHTPREI